ncbi:hypothetical protein [Streptomyces sp. NPDC088258]|uniref:hypothetical protein n=1 Tax=Streptomyces sp. NPDC088258 TaxID=3365849 RepID=UPI0037FAA154
MTVPLSQAEQTAAAVAADYPRLRRIFPHAIGVPLADVQLDAATSSARYSWSSYEVHVTVGHEAHLDTNDPESTALHRQVRAHATLLATDVRDAPAARGHVEWEMANGRPDIVFPTAYTVATADPDDPRFPGAVLATVAKALDYARIATVTAGDRAAEAAEEVEWERQRPEGMGRLKWRRQLQDAREARTAQAEGSAPEA